MLKPIQGFITCTLVLLSSFALAADESNSGNNNELLPTEEVRIFTEALDQIRNHYVNDVSDSELLENAIKGMLEGLDPHSAYLTPSDYQDLQDNTSGEFGGLGLNITIENGFLKVITPIDDTPAYKAGIQSGDIIIKIDDNAIKSLPLDESVDLLRGPKGSKVTLTILRDGQSKPVEFELVRDIIKIKSVKSKILEKQYGYIRIAQFQNNSGIEVEKALKSMLDETANQLQGLVIDLRNNPGGVLTAAIDISDLFIKQGIIVYTEGKGESQREDFYATAKLMFEDKPIVVIINGGSASASEIVAGASVQTILPLPNERALKLTTAKYYTPLGRSIQAKGITPDIVVNPAKVTLVEESLQIKESNLSNHLSNDKKKADKKDKKPEKEDVEDNQLYEAIHLIKAINFSKSAKK
jgi:carboxyl-terminal processing protease